MPIDRLFGIAPPATALRRAIGLVEQEKVAEALPLLTRAPAAGLAEAKQIGRLYLKGKCSPSCSWDQRASRRPPLYGHANELTQTAAPQVFESMSLRRTQEKRTL